MYVSKFLALNLELDPPDCAGLGDDPEDVSGTSVGAHSFFTSVQVKIEEYLGLQTMNSNMLNYLDWIVKHEEQQRRQKQVEQHAQGLNAATDVPAAAMSLQN